MKRAVLVLVLTGMVLATAGCLDEDTDEASEATMMTMNAFWDDYQEGRDNETQTAMAVLESFDDGDTIIIKDQINSLTYNYSENVTTIRFSSYPSTDVSVQGNITDEFQEGDRVTLTSSIIHVTFLQQLQGESWTFHYETFKDGWDTDTNSRAPFPQTTLEHANGG
jgi:hypothetical protein